MFKYFFSLALLLFCAICTTNVHANNIPVSENACNLPAPGNLHVTGVGINYLSFAWDIVPGASGYDYELKEVVSNNLVVSGNTDDNFRTFTGLSPNTLYRLTVWSVCLNNERGGSSAAVAKTDYVIITDLIPNIQGSYPEQGMSFTLFGNNILSESFTSLLIDPSNGNVLGYSFFEVRKKPTGGLSGDDYQIEVVADNPTDPSLGWSYSNQDDIVPVSSPGTPDATVTANYVKVRHTDSNSNVSGEFTPRMLVNVFKNINTGGTATLKWEPLEEGDRYRIIRLGYTGEASQREQFGRMSQNNGTAASGTLPVTTTDVVASEGDDVPVSPAELRTDLNISRQQITSETLKTYPNPFNESLHIVSMPLSEQPATIQLIDINGRLVLSQSVQPFTTNVELPTGNLPQGMYILKYENGAQALTFKVVKGN